MPPSPARTAASIGCSGSAGGCRLANCSFDVHHGGGELLVDVRLLGSSYALRAAGEPFVRDGHQLNPRHRYVIETNMPQWREIEFESDLERSWKSLRGLVFAGRQEAAGTADGAGPDRVVVTGVQSELDAELRDQRPCPAS